MVRITWFVVIAATSGCGDARDGARDKAAEVASQAQEQVGRAATELRGAIALGRKVKAEIDKVYKTDTDYDLTVTADAEHDAALDRLPHVTIDGVTVGYEETSSRSLDGVAYAKHFRATWRRGDRTINVSYYSRKEVDAKAFVAVLERLVPIVERTI
jgi:hypothetical protein